MESAVDVNALAKAHFPNTEPVEASFCLFYFFVARQRRRSRRVAYDAVASVKRFLLFCGR